MIRLAVAGLLGFLTLNPLGRVLRYGNWGNSLHLSASDQSDRRPDSLTCRLDGACWRPLSVEVTRIADQAPQYATFQSHNQKVVENRYGIFLTYLDKVKPIPGRCPHFPQPPCYDSPYLW